MADSSALDLDRIAIIGLGLIGGSIARGLAASGFAGERVGAVVDPAEHARARELALVDRIEADAASAVDGADLIVIAVPLGAVDSVLAEIADVLAPGAVMTDVGSAKIGVMASAREVLGAASVRFVPGHPIAGTEQSGPAAGFATLFNNRRVVLTPDETVDPAAIERVTAFWETLGAGIDRLDAAVHDRLLAATSHLPHALAFTLVDALAAGDDANAVFDYAAGGFVDFTRIAASDPTVWRDIFRANRDAVVASLDDYMRELAETRRAIAADDADAIHSRIARAKRARDGLPAALSARG